MRNIAALAACLCIAGSALASPINAVNDRPVPIAGASASESSVQDLLNPGFPGQDDQDDQQRAGYFRLASGFSRLVAPQYFLEYDTGASFGIFTLPGLDDSNAIVSYDIFPSTATTGWYTDIVWDTGSNWNGDIIVKNAGNVVQSTTSFSGLYRGGFGFWVKSGNNTYYTLDALNDDEAKVLGYSDGSNWAFFFETDWDQEQDFNDGVLFIESLAPVPEPGTLALMGVGAIALFVLRRRRK